MQETCHQETCNLETYHLESPLGMLSVTANSSQVLSVLLGNSKKPSAGRPRLHLTQLAVCQLKEYFSGSRQKFDLPLFERGTDFQKKVWAALRAIDFGQVVTYGELARRAGCHNASRAVGSACGANPLLIVTPCHRVVPAGGGVGGFAAGTDIKRQLLQQEGTTFC